MKTPSKFCHFIAIPFLTVQNGDSALDQASIKGHYKVVELLLGAGANPDLQDKVRTGQESDVCTFKVDFFHGTLYIL